MLPAARCMDLASFILNLFLESLIY